MKNTVFNWEWTLGTLVLMCFENLLHAASTPKDIIQKKLEQLSVTIARIETLFAPSASKLKTVSKPKLKVHSITMFFSPYSWRICRMIFKFWLENKVRYEGLNEEVYVKQYYLLAYRNGTQNTRIETLTSSF